MDDRVFSALNCYIFDSKLKLPFEVQVAIYENEDISFLVRKESVLIDDFIEDTFFGRVAVNIIKSDEKFYYVKPISLTYPEEKEIKIERDKLNCFCYRADCVNCEFGKDRFNENPSRYNDDLVVVDGKPINKNNMIMFPNMNMMPFFGG